MENNLEFWMRGVLLSIIGVLGLIGNALFIYILWKKAKKSSIDFILIGRSDLKRPEVFQFLFIFWRFLFEFFWKKQRNRKRVNENR